jgi:phospholipid/cholesterol/gamma-HCH transport system substrate-binding protein
MKISNETKVGVLAAISIVILVLGYNFLKGENLFTRYNQFYGVYRDVDGLLVNNPVLIHGYKVGHVSEVNFNNETLALYVGIKVDNTVKVPENTIMKIINSDLIGSKAVELLIGDAPILARSGDTLVSEKDPGMAKSISNILSPLNDKVSSVLGGLDSALGEGQLNRTMNDLSVALKAFRRTADEATKTLHGKGPKLDAILTNVEVTTRDLKETGPKLNETIEQLQLASEKIAELELKQTINKIEETATELQTLIKAINQGEGSLGQLATNRELYDNINKASLQLETLLKDIEQHPRRYTGITERQRKKGDSAKEGK